MPHNRLHATESYSLYSHLPAPSVGVTTPRMKGFLNVLRWVAVLPVAFSTLILLDILFNLMPIDLGVPVAFDLAKGGFIGMGCIMGGLFTAPVRRSWVARILAAFCILFSLMALVGTLLGNQDHANSMLLRQVAAAFIGFAVAIKPQAVIEAIEKQ